MNDSCCNTIAEYKNIFKTFIKLLEKYSGNEEIIVRLAFTLGNIVAKLDNCRVKVSIKLLVLLSYIACFTVL